MVVSELVPPKIVWFTAFFVLALVSLSADDRGFHWTGLTVSTFNDNSPYLYDNNGGLDLSIGRGPDDQFTAGFRLDAVADWSSDWSDRLLLSSTLAMYTDTQHYAIVQSGGPDHPAWREDTWSLQALAEKSWETWTLWYGCGALVRGNLGGGTIQNSFHDKIGDIEFPIPYPTDAASGGPFIVGILGDKILDAQNVGWRWTSRVLARAAWDVLGVLQNEGDALAVLDATTGPVQAELSTGARVSLPGQATFLSSMYSSGWFGDADLSLRFGDWLISFGYAIDPYGSAAISQYPAYNDQNQEFHWSVTWGADNPLPWSLRFFP